MEHTIPLRRRADLLFLSSVSFLTNSKQIWEKFTSTFMTSTVCSLFPFPPHFPLLITSRVSFDLSLYLQNISESSFALRLQMGYHTSNQGLTFYTSDFTPSILGETFTNHLQGTCMEQTDKKTSHIVNGLSCLNE